MVCSFVPDDGPRSPAMSTKVCTSSGCMTARSAAQVPPMDQPTTAQFAGSAEAPNRDST